MKNTEDMKLRSIIEDKIRTEYSNNRKKLRYEAKVNIKQENCRQFNKKRIEANQ